MAKFIITFEDNKIKKELFFRGEKFQSIFEPAVFGMASTDVCFLAQYENKMGKVKDDLLQTHLDNLDFGDEDELREAVAYLDEIEDK